MQAARVLRRRLVITGQVQGVGFRPYVYRLAQAASLRGFVYNEPGGVLVEVEGQPDTVRSSPTSSWPGCLPWQPSNPCGRRTCPSWAVRVSSPSPPRPAVRCSTPRSPSIRPYARTACARCTTRPTAGTATRSSTARTAGRDTRIVRGDALRPPEHDDGRLRHVPGLPPGSTCDPASRRFHAQPIACRGCGPRRRLVDTHGERRMVCDDAHRLGRGDAAEGKDRRRQGSGRLSTSPAAPTTTRPSAACGQRKSRDGQAVRDHGARPGRGRERVAGLDEQAGNALTGRRAHRSCC